jgi:hypothetical protein
MTDRKSQRYLNGELIVVVDVADLERAAEFWTNVLGYVREDASETYLSLVPADGVGVEVLLQRVADRLDLARPHGPRQQRVLHPPTTAAGLAAHGPRVVEIGSEIPGLVTRIHDSRSRSSTKRHDSALAAELWLRQRSRPSRFASDRTGPAIAAG